MARKQEPVTDEEIEAAKRELRRVQEEVREQLAADLGGDPEDYDASAYFHRQAEDGEGEAVPDGGE
ncbi:hypothetical protein [Haloglomus litoreum]|uniref:hypothetical protein n=1 Tax=Haloglomus litoreum TaxID=3034026 RepID=UPI0023E8251E|nr:hypothetical protein [Haloglomus sp. DT116]